MEDRMVSMAAVFLNSIPIPHTVGFIADASIRTTWAAPPPRRSSRCRRIRRLLVSSSSAPSSSSPPQIAMDSLRVLEWDKVCDSVASFAATPLGKQSLKEQLWSLDNTYDDSLGLLRETHAAVEMHNYAAMVDFASIDSSLVESAIQCARWDSPVSGSQAMAIVALLQLAEALQFNLKAAIKKDADSHHRFIPLSQRVLELVISRSLMKFIQQLIDEDGSVRDSASSALKQSRYKVRLLDRKLHDLMESLIRNKMKDTPSLEMSNTNGRWCIKSGTKLETSFEGLLLSSGSGAGCILEPLSAVPLNDELQLARVAVAKAEADVLFKITKKMQVDISDVEIVFKNMIELDVVNARALYSMSFGGSFPDLYLPQSKDFRLHTDTFSKDGTSVMSNPTQRKWTLYLPKASHPLLVQQHRQKLQKAMKDVSDATAQVRRRKQGGGMTNKTEPDLDISSLEMKVAEIKQSSPVPIDVFVGQNTRVVVITGPNTGGKTICLKTVGLAAMLAKSGLYVLASEPIKIPWFDFVFAGIGDEQSLSQSLSTFSGHLKQISEILSRSRSLSLVLLDEVGAGTNPSEGAALGMSVLESFAEAGPTLTMATTHHGQLKTLKYSNKAFENACMEFDEIHLRPTFRILWGVPGRSNAINIAKRLGMPKAILDGARELYGAAGVEINEIVVDMERFKRSFHKQIEEAKHYLTLAKNLHRNLRLANKKVIEHCVGQSYEMAQEISNAAASARWALDEKVRHARKFHGGGGRSSGSAVGRSENAVTSVDQRSMKEGSECETPVVTETETCKEDTTRGSISDKRAEIPKVGQKVVVPSLNKEAVVLKVEPSKEEIVVQAGSMKLKLKLVDLT